MLAENAASCHKMEIRYLNINLKGLGFLTFVSALDVGFTVELDFPDDESARELVSVLALELVFELDRADGSFSDLLLPCLLFSLPDREEALFVSFRLSLDKAAA